ncbi:rab domain-containing cell division control protein [Halteromyces radiatus]|uniref:rab domain-containing cell division control protein n=1 Tax=Halteromyces radiatus TaxID=101107 RepID=UPI00222029B6|nr:rab domain-containing cell division control protein [Halteromyces radiatus]KAI8082814.1 rab domain-containing cell division control protein [Halteromyces radiatus]
MNYSLDDIRSILSRKHKLPVETENSLMDLRIFVLSHSIPSQKRGLLWKLLLRVNEISAKCYISLVHRGPSLMDSKIRNDTFRTMTTDENFLEQVSEDMLIRVLNAFVWISSSDGKELDTPEELRYRSKFIGWFPEAGLTYVQGMNVLVAPFLMVMPEMEAFYAFSNFMWRWCPLYIQPNLKGVHSGIKLLDMCLKMLDPQLYYLLLSKGFTANMYAIPSVMTFCACTPPSKELLLLWDVMFAFGLHLNILFIIAQLALIRKDLMASSSPMKLLRKLPSLQAEKIIKITLSSIKQLPPDLYEKLVRHAYDESVADSLGIQLSAGVSQSEDLHRLPPYLAEALL